MSFEISYLKININKNISLIEEKLSFRKNQLTIAKKKDNFLIENFIRDKLLNKQDLKYNFIKKNNGLYYFVDNTIVSKGLHIKINNMINLDFKDCIKTKVKHKVKELNMIIFKVDNNLLVKINKNEFKKYIIEEKKQVKPKPKSKKTLKNEPIINDFNIEI